jgi:hypothetical protein
MNTTSTPEFAAAELSYRRSRISTAHRRATATAERRWHRHDRQQHSSVA